MTAPGPPKAIGKGLFISGFTAMPLVERFAAGRSLYSLGDRAGPAGRGDLPGDAGRDVRAGRALLAPLADAIAARNWDSWHFDADETAWRVFAPKTDRAGQVVALGLHRR